MKCYLFISLLERKLFQKRLYINDTCHEIGFRLWFESRFIQQKWQVIVFWNGHFHFFNHGIMIGNKLQQELPSNLRCVSMVHHMKDIFFHVKKNIAASLIVFIISYCD